MSNNSAFSKEREIYPMKLTKTRVFIKIWMKQISLKNSIFNCDFISFSQTKHAAEADALLAGDPWISPRPTLSFNRINRDNGQKNAIR
jgi:hypothetical protein